MQNYRGWLPNRKSAYPGTGYPGRNPTRCPRTVNSPNNCPPFDADNSLVVLLSGTKILSAFKRGGSLDDFTVPNNCHRYVVGNKPIALKVLVPGGSPPRYPVCAVPWQPGYPGTRVPGYPDPGTHVSNNGQHYPCLCGTQVPGLCVPGYPGYPGTRPRGTGRAGRRTGNVVSCYLYGHVY